MERRARVLVVEDDDDVRDMIVTLLKSKRYDVAWASDAFKAIGKLGEVAPDAVVTDLVLPGIDGIELLRHARKRDPNSIGIVMTAHGDVSTAVRAMREGATDFVVKPLDVDQLDVMLKREIEHRRRRLCGRPLSQRGLINVIGESPVMRAIFDAVLQIASSRATVLISGESGTGKELVAAAVHEESARRKGPFVRLSCAALAETLLESELFGHERGAFTGAVTRREGRFHQADGGTLFLDEIGELSPATQIKLLRFLQEREFERVGGNETIKVDVRIVAATNRDLAALVRARLFREDLYYRLNVVNLHVPPLRERRSDIPLLAAHFLRRFSAENGRSIDDFSDAAMERMMAHAWAGNVRELENAVERAVVVCRGSRIEVDDVIPMSEAVHAPADSLPPIPGASLAELERVAILRTLEFTGGATAKAAAILGISARKIQYRLQQWQADPRRRRRSVRDIPDEDL